MNKKTLPYLLLLFLSMLAIACGIDRNVKRGEEFLALGEYHDAAAEFKKAYQKTPVKERAKRGQYALRMAQCYERINQAAKAATAYRNALRYGAGNSDTHLALARQWLKTGNYQEAAQLFQSVLDSMPGNPLALNGLASARQAAAWKKAGSRYTVRRMDLFNSRRDDYSPMLFGDDGNRIYFSSTRNDATGNEMSGITGTKAADIFFSEKNNQGKWSRPEVVSGSLNTAYDEGACCFSPDHQTMYFTQCTIDATAPRAAQIMVSHRTDATWSKGEPLVLNYDSLSSYAHPAVSPDGKWLYFTSDRAGGLGGLDIWRARLTGAGPGEPENLGPTINTPGNESFPTFRPNGDLYFSSDGHPGMGGLDIFIAHTQGNRFVISHPGYPLNSQADDFGMTFEGPHNRGFFSSNRNDAHGWDHLYAFENPEIVQTIKGWVYEMDGYELPAATVYLVGNDGTNKKLSVRGDGSFTETVTPGVDYVMLATCKGYLNHQEEISIVQRSESVEHTLQFPLASITAPVLIDNIFYDLNKATLRPESSKALDQLVALLQQNPHVTIELAAHCDYRGSREYNLQLARQRAETVVNYLVGHGIDRARLTPKGYGKEQPKTIRKKTTEKYPWLKEGDVLTEEFIARQAPEMQEVCNQLNRRTEFQVLRTTFGLLDKQGKLKEDVKKEMQKQAEEAEREEFYF